MFLLVENKALFITCFGYASVGLITLQKMEVGNSCQEGEPCCEVIERQYYSSHFDKHTTHPVWSVGNDIIKKQLDGRRLIDFLVMPMTLRVISTDAFKVNRKKQEAKNKLALTSRLKWLSLKLLQQYRWTRKRQTVCNKGCDVLALIVTSQYISAGHIHL